MGFLLVVHFTQALGDLESEALEKGSWKKKGLMIRDKALSLLWQGGWARFKVCFLHCSKNTRNLASPGALPVF